MARMRVGKGSERGGAFELVEREVPEPGPGEALVRVQACGICHSDSYVKEGGFPGVTYPAVPGHEVAGTVDALGEGSRGWAVGQRVGGGWFRRNRRWLHAHRVRVTPGAPSDAAYADYVLVRLNAIAHIPDELSAEDAASLLWARVTTYI